MKENRIDKFQIDNDDEELIGFFKRRLIIKDECGYENELDILMSLPIDTRGSVSEIPSYQCILTMRDNKSSRKYHVNGSFDKFNAIINGIIFTRTKIDEIKGTVIYLNQPFSGFPLIINSSFGIDHIEKSEKLIADEFSALMEKLSQKVEAYERDIK